MFEVKTLLLTDLLNFEWILTTSKIQKSKQPQEEQWAMEKDMMQQQFEQELFAAQSGGDSAAAAKDAELREALARIAALEAENERLMANQGPSSGDERAAAEKTREMQGEIDG
jgi:hypothetical protein